MRRTVLALSAFVLFSSGLSSPVAADSVVVVNGFDGFPEDDFGNDLGGLAAIGCDDPFQRQFPSGPFMGYQLDDTAPLGRRVWQIDAEDGSGTAIGAYLLDSATSAATVMTAEFKPDTTSTGVAFAGFFPGSGGGDVYWSGFAGLPALTGGWQTVSSAGVSYHWRRYDFTSQTYLEDGGSATYADFVAAHGGTGVGEFALAYGCDGSRFRTDDWTLGQPGTTTTFDLEGEAPQVVITRSRQTITAGEKVTLTGDLTTEDGGGFAGAELELQKRAFEEPDFSAGGTAETGPGGEPASLTVRPTQKTAYRWFYAESGCCDAATSEVVTIQVRIAVTGTLTKAKVHRGKAIKLTGRTTPAKPGSGVTLYRKTASGQKKLDTGKVGDDGRFLLSAKAGKKGTWKVFAAVAGDAANLAGTSPVRTVKVT